MRPWALVPVKCFDQGKSRLGDVLEPAARAEVARGMFDRVMGVLVSLVRGSELSGVLVVTDGAEVAERASTHGAEAMFSAGTGPGRSLGAIVDEGLAELVTRGADAAIVLMGDLPLLAGSDVRALLALLDASDVVLAPDEVRTGTNALAMRLPAPMPTRFCGGESLGAHLNEAREKGLRVSLCERPGFLFDVDRPEDIPLFRGEAG